MTEKRGKENKFTFFLCAYEFGRKFNVKSTLIFYCYDIIFEKSL